MSQMLKSKKQRYVAGPPPVDREVASTRGLELKPSTRRVEHEGTVPKLRGLATSVMHAARSQVGAAAPAPGPGARRACRAHKVCHAVCCGGAVGWY